MRALTAALLALPLLTMAIPSASARAPDPYRWCALYSGAQGGGAGNCGFVTLEQCMATLAGMGGYCVPNPFYTGTEPHEPRKRARRPA